MTTGPALDPPTIPFTPAVAATAEPVREAPTTQARGRFDERIEAVLRGAAEGLGCVAAELRLVDDHATEVRTSHHFAADDAFFPTTVTPLAEAAGELAAMSGSAVVLEDQQALEDWDVEQPVGSAVCVPVASDTTIHGALWLYAAEERDADRSQLQLAEIIAGRIAVEFERHWLLEEQRRHASARPAANPRPSAPGRRTVAGGRRTDRPVFHHDSASAVAAPTTDSTDTSNIAGMAIASADAARAMHVEHRLDDGRVLLAAAAVIDTPGLNDREAAHIKQTVAAALDRHADESRDAGELLTGVGRHLWRHTTGGDAVSMAVAIVDEETGEATVALAGDAAALRVQAARRTPLATDLPPIGWDPFDEEASNNGESEADEGRYPSLRFELAVRERLVLAVGGPRQTGELTADQMASGFKPATADDHRRMTARETLARASAAPAAEGSPLLAASVLRRD